MMKTFLFIVLLISAGVAGCLLAGSRIRPFQQFVIIAAIALSSIFAWIVSTKLSDHAYFERHLDEVLYFSAVAGLILLPTVIVGWFVGWAVRGMRGNGSPRK